MKVTGHSGGGKWREWPLDQTPVVAAAILGYEKEASAMAYTMDDFRREVEEERLALARKLLKSMPPEEILKTLSAEEIEGYLKRLKGKRSSGDASSATE